MVALANLKTKRTKAERNVTGLSPIHNPEETSNVLIK